MFSNVWAFVQDLHNQAVLSWVGGGLVVVVGGLWTAFKFFAQKDKLRTEPPPTVSASNGGVAAGRDIRNTKINARRTDSEK
jgi:hypothetical protein